MILKKFALIGNPVEGSLSPWIHKNFAAQFDIPISYQAIAVDANNLTDTINSFFANGGCGLNITAPYKEVVFQQLKNHTVAAVRARAVNTLFIQNGILCGANTDGAGLLADFKAKNIVITGKRLVIFGAGGAVRGIMQALISQKPSNILLINRDLDKAAKIVVAFKDLMEISVGDYAEVSTADIVINAVSADCNCYADFNFANSICYDLNYKTVSQFRLIAQQRRAIKVFNGLGMLVQQAALAFELWHEKKPNLAIEIT